MPTVIVAGLPGSYAPGLAERIGAALRRDAEVLVRPGPSVEPADLVIFADDAPVGRDGDGQRTPLVAAIAARRARGEAIAVVRSRKDAAVLVAALGDDGIPQPPGALQRVFVASGQSGHSHEYALRIAEALGLPLVEPEAAGTGASAAGWGPRYADIARRERWLVHTHVWHAVEPLTEVADLTLHIETPASENRDEFPNPSPTARKWRFLFAPWLRRYPGVEANLLGRELDAHPGRGLLHLRDGDDMDAVIDALKRSAPAATP